MKGKERNIQRQKEKKGENGQRDKEKSKRETEKGRKGENRQKKEKKKSDKGWVALEGRHTVYPGTLRHTVATRTN